jgi:hypothetical protein
VWVADEPITTNRELPSASAKSKWQLMRECVNGSYDQTRNMGLTTHLQAIGFFFETNRTEDIKKIVLRKIIDPRTTKATIGGKHAARISVWPAGGSCGSGRRV